VSTGFDVLVIGGGSAGSVVASRLSENSACRVGLIEAGHEPSDPDIFDPLKWPALGGRSYDWDYKTTPQPFTANRAHDWARGRLLGGSSCINAMGHVRGHPDDFRPWAEAGGPRWSYDGLLAGFMRSEDFSGPESPERGRGGPMPVYLPDAEVSPVARAYMEAGRALGAPQLRDHNGRELAGTAPNSLNIRNGRRVTAAEAYLPPAVLSRPNLSLLLGHEVERLTFDGARVTGVLAVRGGETVTLHADRIVLCAGAIATPLLLMRSGLGPRATLATAGIECRDHLPGIGANLQDHLLALGNVYAAKKPVPPSRLQHSESLMYLHSGDITRASGAPDIVLACVMAPSVTSAFTAPAYGSAYTFLCGVTHPTSRGTIRPGGPSRTDAPLIDPNYLATEHDRSLFRAALKTARLVGRQPALDDWRATELLPGEDQISDDALDRFITLSASTHHHPAGTCKMGTDDLSVVDEDLAVHGLAGLHVVDASILPTLTSGPIHAAILAIAETWARG
jgi:pyridoxine 4-oxidase